MTTQAISSKDMPVQHTNRTLTFKESSFLEHFTLTPEVGYPLLYTISYYDPSRTKKWNNQFNKDELEGMFTREFAICHCKHQLSKLKQSQLDIEFAKQHHQDDNEVTL